MGCDIHAYIESQPHKKDHPDYWWLDAELHVLRDYTMFGILAGVRGGVPLYAPRGWDKDSATAMKYCLYIVDHDTDSEGFCSRREAEGWIKRGLSEMVGENKVTGPDWHTPSWLIADELERVIISHKELRPEQNCCDWLAILAFMKEIPTSRLVFWFDN